MRSADLTGLPVVLRTALVAGLVFLIAGAGFFAWRWYSRPTTLTIAVGSFDGEASRVMSALASRLAQQKAPVRLSLVEANNALEAASVFASGKVDLAVVRGDVVDPAQAQAVAIVAHAVALLVVPTGSAITDMAGLKRVAVGVIGNDTNKRLIKVLTDEYGLAQAGVTFRNLAPADVRRALESKEVRALLVVMPLSDKYLSMLRGFFPPGARAGPVLIPLDQAGAIAEKERAYESFDVPKGTLRGAPANPADDVTTLRTSFYLVAQKKLDNTVITDLTEALMSARRDLLAEYPLLAQVKAPDIEASAYLPVHPGAAAFYNGTQESFLDTWGNIIFLAPMILGAIASILAAAWKFLRAGTPMTREAALDVLYELGRRIRVSRSAAELEEIEGNIDRVLEGQRQRVAAGQEANQDVVALNIAAHRLENLIHDRRIALAAPGRDHPAGPA
jgi:TRAP-type uncharacterized transport system substrate-binding protein